MKRLISAVLVAGGVAVAAWATGWTATYPIGADGSVGLTNTQANSSWVPVSVMFKFTAPGSGTTEVWRVSQAQSFMLGSCAFTNVTSVVWVPDAPYPFGLGDALVMRSSLTNGIVQVIRKGD